MQEVNARTMLKIHQKKLYKILVLIIYFIVGIVDKVYSG